MYTDSCWCSAASPALTSHVGGCEFLAGQVCELVGSLGPRVRASILHSNHSEQCDEVQTLQHVCLHCWSLFPRSCSRRRRACDPGGRAVRPWGSSAVHTWHSTHVLIDGAQVAGENVLPAICCIVPIPLPRISTLAAGAGEGTRQATSPGHSPHGTLLGAELHAVAHQVVIPWLSCKCMTGEFCVRASACVSLDVQAGLLSSCPQ